MSEALSEIMKGVLFVVFTLIIVRTIEKIGGWMIRTLKSKFRRAPKPAVVTSN